MAEAFARSPGEDRTGPAAPASTEREFPPGRGARFWSCRLAGPAVLLVVGIALVRWSWMAWPDAVSDTGRELYLAWQLARGKVLYRDVAHFNGPLSAYGNALWFRSFGTSLRSLVLADLLVLSSLSALLYAGGARLGGRVGAFWSCLVFLVVFGVGPLIPMGSFSYLAPYSHELTHGALLLLLLVAALWRHLESGGTASCAVAGGILGLLFLTKAEVVAAGLAGCGIAAVLARRLRSDPVPRQVGVFLAAAALPPLSAWALLSAAMKPREALLGMLGAWRFLFDRELSAMPYFRIGQGTYDLGASLRSLLFWSFAWVAAFGSVWASARFLSRSRGPARWLGLLGSLAAPAVVFAFRERVDWLEAGRPLPVFLAGLLILDGRRVLASRGGPAELEETARRIVVGVISLALLARIFFFARVWHYGFVLAMPATVLLVATLMGPLASAVGRQGGSARGFRLGAGGILLAALAGHLALIGETLQGRTVRVGTGADSFRADGRGQALAAVLRFLEEEAPAGATLAVLPDGVILNFLSRRPNSTPYVIANPADVRIFGEERMLEAYQAAPPDFIALVHCDTAIYGYRFFGRDYAVRLASWIASNYRAVGRAGALPFASDEFGILILRRAELPAAGPPRANPP